MAREKVRFIRKHEGWFLVVTTRGSQPRSATLADAKKKAGVPHGVRPSRVLTGGYLEYRFQ